MEILYLYRAKKILYYFFPTVGWGIQWGTVATHEVFNYPISFKHIAIPVISVIDNRETPEDQDDKTQTGVKDITLTTCIPWTWQSYNEFKPKINVVIIGC